MPPVWVSSPSAARRHAAYAIERTPNAVVQAIGTGVAAMVAQLPWGPDGSKVTTPSGSKDMIYTFAPPGMDHTGSGYLSMIGKGWPTLKVVRALGAAATQAAAPLGNIVTAVAKYNGAAGNSLVGTVSIAGDGNPNHFRLVVQVVGPSGSTSETYDNLDYSGTAVDSRPNFSSSYLLGGITKQNSGRPQNGTYTFSGGNDGVPNALSYTGTPGTGNAGIAALEGDQSIRHVFVDDPGAATRQAVNAALLQHVQAMGDRCAYINGNQGQALAAVAADVSNYRSARVVYVDPWVYVLDDVTGTKHLVPGASFAASVAAQLSPSTSIAWKDPEVIAMLSGIEDLEFDRGNGAADNTDQGVATLIREQNGGFTFEAGVLTVAPLDPARRNHTRTRMGDYAAVSMVRSSRSFIDAPNVPSNQQAVVHMVQAFMDKLVAAKDSDPNHTPHCLAYDIPPLGTFNTQDDLDNGMLTVPVDMKTSSGIERLFYSILFGESVQVKAG
jgi:phage tail sheath protein FI